MEKQLFDWDGWDEADTAHLQFYGVKLKVDIGEFKAGEEFDVATINFQTGDFQLIRDESIWEFKLKLCLTT